MSRRRHHHHCRKSKSGTSESKEKSSKKHKKSGKRSSHSKDDDSSAEDTTKQFSEGIRMVIKLGKNPSCRILSAAEIIAAKTKKENTDADKQAMEDNGSRKIVKEPFRDIGNGQDASGVNRLKQSRSRSSLFKNPNDYPYILYELDNVKRLQKKKRDRSPSMSRDKPIGKRSLMDDSRKKLKSDSKDQKHSKDKSISKHRSASKSKSSTVHQSRSCERKRKRSYESDDDTSPISSKKLKSDNFVGPEDEQKNVRKTLKFESDFQINSPQFVIMNDVEDMNSAQLVFA